MSLWKGIKSVAGSSKALKAGSSALLAEAGIGAGVGAVAGGVYGGLSDNESVLGGMAKGALLGSIGGAGTGTVLRGNQAAGAARLSDIAGKMKVNAATGRGVKGFSMLNKASKEMTRRSTMAFGGLGSALPASKHKQFATLMSNTPLQRAFRFGGGGAAGGVVPKQKQVAGQLGYNRPTPAQPGSAFQPPGNLSGVSPQAPAIQMGMDGFVPQRPTGTVPSGWDIVRGAVNSTLGM